MKLAVRMAAALALSLGIAWGLSWLPQGGSGATNPVFNPGGTVQLSETNLVDALSNLTLDLEIARVNMQQAVLSVDLFLPEGVSGARFVYHDLYELLRFSWTGTANVNHLVVRIMLQDGGGRGTRELLLAMEAKRSQWNKEEQLPPEISVLRLKNALEKQANFSYTPKWIEQS